MTRLTRAEMKGKAQTVLGLIDPAQLGSTLMHEHLIWNIVPPAKRAEIPPGTVDSHPWWGLLNHFVSDLRNSVQRDRAAASRATAEIIAHGGQTVVELTIGGLEPDPEGLAQVARDTGAHIVMGCGHYVHDYQDPANHDRSVDSFAKEMIDQACPSRPRTPPCVHWGDVECQKRPAFLSTRWTRPCAPVPSE